MSPTLSFVLLALTISSAVIASENVLVMTDDNAQELFDSHELLLVKFYAPWCGHCKSLAPKYDQAADILQADGSNIRLAKVDATENKALASKHEIQGYPTLLFFKNGKPTKYTGGREAQQIVDWLNKKNGPSVLEIETVEQLDELKESKKIVLGHFTETFPLFNEIADEIDEVVFVSSKNADVLKAASLEGEGISLIRRDGSEFEITSLGKEQIESLSQLKAWIHGHQLAAVNEFTQETANLILGGEIKDFHFLLAARSSENFDEIYAQFTAAAKLFRGRVVFVFLDADKEESARIMEFLGVSSSDLPTDRIVNLKADIQKYKPAAGQSYQEFTQTYLDGGAGRDFKSQELPADWDAQPVKILVAENFEKVALDKSKLVFVKFYAPWCGHCKSLAPIWDELAQKYEGNDNVVIAKLDSTENELEQVHIQSFPTLKLWPVGADEPIDYDGERNLEQLEKFVEKHISGNAEGHSEL